MTRLGALLALAASLTLALTACGGTDDPEATDSPTAGSTDPNVGDRALEVGETREGAGATTQLLEVTNPLPPSGEVPPPEEGMQWSALRIKQCVREDVETSEEITSSYATEWFVATPEGDQFNTNSGWDWPQPVFPQAVTMQPGECVQGWMVVPVAKGAQVEKVIYRLYGEETLAEWAVA